MNFDPVWEVIGSVQVLRHGGGGVFFERWRCDLREQVARDRELRAAVHALIAVATRLIRFPDLPAPVPDEQALYFRHAVEPYEEVIGAAVRLEATNRAQAHLSRGTEGLLTGFGPAMTWAPPVLAVDHHVERDLHLEGRGLLLVPCRFWPTRPVVAARPRAQPVLVFPVTPEARLTAAGAGAGDSLKALLGPTRAAILRSVLDHGTSTHLARTNHISPATVSHHTTVLREAGLITTRRVANHAVHAITPLGLRLLARG
ncbi:ArsR/SmtB family transcription factor [Saccharothrix sp. BKS2]|uniref:ArsR/SmtB family transcription factor n=1 Tax=Saccharothrix sp. BKS2 TaxID=3064400 RepID=UPI0039EB37AA